MGTFASRDWLGDDRLQCSHEGRPHAAQLVLVGLGKAPKQLFTPHSHLDQDLASVDIATASCRESSLDQAIHQFHGAVMADLETFGENPNGRTLSLGEALDGKQELVLLGLEASGPRFAFAEREEATDLIPKLGQGMVVDRGKHIVARYNDRGRARGTSFLASQPRA